MTKASSAYKKEHEYVYRGFIYQGVNIWNIIIDNIEVKNSIAKFTHFETIHHTY